MRPRVQRGATPHAKVLSVAFCEIGVGRLPVGLLIGQVLGGGGVFQPACLCGVTVCTLLWYFLVVSPGCQILVVQV